MQIGAALPAEFEIIVGLKATSRTEHYNSSFRVIAGANVINSRLINATKRNTIKKESFGTIFGRRFPKNGRLGATIGRGNGRR
jgi:hypothetical protein